MYNEGVCANAGPHSQKLHGRVTNICRNRMRQQYRSAMVPPQHEPTSCQIDVVSSRQVSMLHTSLLTVLNYCHMLGFACSHITLDTILPMKPLLLLTSLRLCFNTFQFNSWAMGVKKNLNM